jgi:HD domain-containing protein
LLVETAALLHDVDKLLPTDDQAKALPHGDGSADWLARQGHPELSRAVAGHPVTKLIDGEAFKRWAAFATREERVVAYADKRAGQRLESMDERFAEWSRRHPQRPGTDEPTWSADVAREVRARAGRLEAELCRAADITPAEVGRASWTAKALQAARERAAKRGTRPA